MTVTIRTVAEVAGVSITTVSRALADTGRVKPGTRQRVIEVARQLGYAPNLSARALITGRHRTLALVVPNLSNPHFAAVAKGAQARARSLGYLLLIADTDEDSAVERAIISQIGPSVDAMILSVTPSSSAAADVLAYQKVRPILLINRQLPGIPAVLPDMSIGVQQSLNHLWALGHRKIGYLGGDPFSWTNEIRIAQVRETANELGMDVVEFGPYATGFQGGGAAMEPILASDVTAVLAFNDLMALGLIAASRLRNLSVPNDISVIGIDDLPQSAMSVPTLTSIRVHPGRTGAAAVDAIVGLLDRGDQNDQSPRLVPTELIVRESTGDASTVRN